MDIGTLIIDGDYSVKITKKDLKVIKRLMADIESEICKKTIVNVREVQENDPRLKTLYKLLGY